MILKVLDEVRRLIFVERGDVVASKADLSAFSLPGTSTCDISFFNVLMNSELAHFWGKDLRLKRWRSQLQLFR